MNETAPLVRGVDRENQSNRLGSRVDAFRSKIKEIFSHKSREWRAALKTVEQINQLEKYYQGLTPQDLQQTSTLLKEQLQNSSLDEILPHAFAAVREASRRTLGLRHFDVQLAGGLLLHQRQVVEMQTGEGKTLVATLPLFLNALAGKGTHLVTTNDYLAKSAVQWMGPVYEALGLSVAVIQTGKGGSDQPSYFYDPNYSAEDDRYRHLRPVSRQEAYQADITYGTNHEFAFDYLRDNMVADSRLAVQRGLHYALVDEVDSVLIDESRSPLIISGPGEVETQQFRQFNILAKKLQEGVDYRLDRRAQTVVLTESGVTHLEKMLNIASGESLYDEKHNHLVAYLDTALRAKEFYRKGKDYLVKDGEAIILSEGGRLMYGKRFSGGLHQAIEAKESLEVKPFSRTYATISYQNFFRMYNGLAGMTGTAKTAREELRSIYGLEMTILPTNVEHRASQGELEEVSQLVSGTDVYQELFATEAQNIPSRSVRMTTYRGGQELFFRRLDLPDQVFLISEAKDEAVIEEIKAVHHKNRPILVGTTSVDDSEGLSQRLSEMGIVHQVLNAKYHEQEAAIIAQAGRLGTVTIATNMAGRGVDIMLGGNPELLTLERLKEEGIDIKEIDSGDWEKVIGLVKEGADPSPEFSEKWVDILVEVFAECSTNRKEVRQLGGLHVIGTQRHEARRIDNQLRGRAGRQGDPGSSQFFVALDDPLMIRFGGQGLTEVKDSGTTILGSAFITRLIRKIQQLAEYYNYDIRKHALDYDDVINQQRNVIYEQRRVLLTHNGLSAEIKRMIEQEVRRVVIAHTASVKKENWKKNELLFELRLFLSLTVLSRCNLELGNEESLEQMIQQLQREAIVAYESTYQNEGNRQFTLFAAGNTSLKSLQERDTVQNRLVLVKARERLTAKQFESLYEIGWQLLSADDQEIIKEILSEAAGLYQARILMLKILDQYWVNHLTVLDDLREGIGLRAFGQEKPLLAYQREAYALYQEMVKSIRMSIVKQALT